MKNRDLLDLVRGIDAVAQIAAPHQFSYAMAKTRRALIRELEILLEVKKPSEAFEKYNEERLALCRKHSKTGDDGEPLTEDLGNGRSRFILKNEKKFNKAWEAVKANHQKALDDQEKKDKEYEAMLDGDAQVALHLVSLDNVPDQITVAQLEGIFEMVSENGVA